MKKKVNLKLAQLLLLVSLLGVIKVAAPKFSYAEALAAIQTAQLVRRSTDSK